MTIQDVKFAINLCVSLAVLVSHGPNSLMNPIDFSLEDFSLLGQVSLEPFLVFICGSDNVRNTIVKTIQSLALNSCCLHRVLK